MTFTFTRQRYEDTLFQDINLYMPDCIKYGLYEDEVLTGMLVTNRSKTYAKFRDAKPLTCTSKSLFFIPTQYKLKDESGIDFANVMLKRPCNKNDEVHIHFSNEAGSCKLLYKNIARDTGPYNIIIEIVSNDDSVFIFNEYAHRKFSSVETTRPMAGIIELTDGLNKDKLWAFLLAIQLYFWSLETD